MSYKVVSLKKDKFGGYRFIGVEKNLNGSYVINDGKNKRIYYDYSKDEAIKEFKKEFK